MKGHEADEEHRQDQEHVGAHRSSGLLRTPGCGSVLGPTAGPWADAGLCSGVRPVQLFGDEGVTDDHGHQVTPEDNLAHVIDQLMPAQAGDRLQVTAFEIWGGWNVAGEDHVGQAQAQQEDPDGCWQKLPPGQPGWVGPFEGLQGLPAAVDADEAEEEDADVHGEVEEHRGDPTHKDTQGGGSHIGIRQNLQKRNSVSPLPALSFFLE